MQCKKCGKEWNSSVAMKFCPFCGVSLKEDAPSTEFADIPSVITYLVNEKGKDILLEPGIVISYIMDLVSKQDREKKLFRMGCHHGGLERVHQILAEPKQNRREIMVLNLKQYLMENAFMSEENAVELINMTLAGVNLSALRLSQESTVEKSVAARQKETVPQKETNPTDQGDTEVLPQQRSDTEQGENRSIQHFLKITPTVAAPSENGEKLTGQQLNQSAAKTETISDLELIKKDVEEALKKRTPYRQAAWLNPKSDIRKTQGIIAVSRYHILGVKSDGTVLCTGASYRTIPAQVEQWNNIVKVETNALVAVALASDGTVKIAGNDGAGRKEVQLWRDVIDISIAFNGVIIGVKCDGTAVTAGKNQRHQFETIRNWTDLKAMSAGSFHTVGLKSDGTVTAAGNSAYCRGVENWKGMTSIAAGIWHTVGLKSDGTVVAAGEQNNGKCNVNVTIQSR